MTVNEGCETRGRWGCAESRVQKTRAALEGGDQPLALVSILDCQCLRALWKARGVNRRSATGLPLRYY